MRRRVATTRRSPDVVVVSNNPETVDGLESYLAAAQVAARCTDDIDRCAGMAGPATLAFVVFPDDFDWKQVVAAIADLAAQHPSAIPILITSNPKRFDGLLEDNVIVMPRPAWGWKILDAIRVGGNRPAPRS